MNELILKSRTTNHIVMKNYKLSVIFILALIISSCSTGKKALQKGNYADAVFKSIERLRSNPDNKKAMIALKEAYPLALKTLEVEIEEILQTNEINRYGIVASKYQALNDMAQSIRRSPAALKIIPKPKTFIAQLTGAKDKAADEAYQNGVDFLNKGSRLEAREAFYAFQSCLNFNPNYKDARTLIDVAMEKATLKVVVEQLPVSGRYKLSADFFYDQVLSYLNSNKSNEFVSFLTTKEAKAFSEVDQIMQMEFFDFQVGASKESQKEKEFTSSDSVKVGSATIGGKKVDVFNKVTANLISYKREVSSGGILQVKVIDVYSNKILEQKKFPGTFVWTGEWAKFNGDERALTKEQLDLCKRRPADPPAPQELFYEFTKPIFYQTSSYLRNFYRKY